MILTRQNIGDLSGHYTRKGFTRRQIELLGFTWPAPQNWIDMLIGCEMTEADYKTVKDAYVWKSSDSREHVRPLPIKKSANTQITPRYMGTVPRVWDITGDKTADQKRNDREWKRYRDDYRSNRSSNEKAKWENKKINRSA